MYLMVQVILVLSVRTEPAVIALCAAVLSAPELLRLGWVNTIMAKLSVAGSDLELESELQLSAMVCCAY